MNGQVRDARSLSSHAQERLRVRAVQAVLRGEKQARVARMFGVTRQAVHKWVETHRKRGLQSLQAKRKGRPRDQRLLPWHEAYVAATIMTRSPRQLKLSLDLWSRKAIAQLIEKKFGLRLSRWMVSSYLRRWGFTSQRCVRRVFEKTPGRLHVWLEEEDLSIPIKLKDMQNIINGEEGLQRLPEYKFERLE